MCGKLPVFLHFQHAAKLTCLCCQYCMVMCIQIELYIQHFVVFTHKCYSHWAVYK